MFQAPSDITEDQARNTGMAMVLLALIIHYFTAKTIFLHLGVGFLVVDMIYPRFFRPAATVWLGLSHILGTVMTKVLLSLIFVVLVTPVALLRRMFRSDPMMSKRWKSADGSVFQHRDHEYGADDLESPF
jgi:multisubunit Na+/H+ antiporter MnhG subunit